MLSSDSAAHPECSLVRKPALTRTCVRPHSVTPHRRIRSISPVGPDSHARSHSAESAQVRARPSAEPAQGSIKRGMVFRRKRASKKPVTELRAVPPNAHWKATPISPQQIDHDMANLPNQEVLTNISPLSEGLSSPRSFGFRSRKRSNSFTAPSPSHLSPIHFGKEPKFFPNRASHKSIGTYKDGIIHWDQPFPDPSKENQARARSCGSSKRRPQIQVVIPQEQLNKPLPTSPFLPHERKQASHQAEVNQSQHIMSAAAEFATVELSPPSGSTRHQAQQAHQSTVVSPLSVSQQHGDGTQQSSITTQMSKSEAAPSLSNSSLASPRSNSSSLYDDSTSFSSLDAGSPPLDSKFSKSHQRSASAAFSITSPIAAGVFDSPPRVSSKSDETGPRVGRAWDYHRRHTPHPAIEDDEEFRPTCQLRPQCRVSTKRSGRKSHRQRGKPMNQTMGVISQAIDRSTSWQFAERPYSPTLSEAENDLEQHLDSFMDDFMEDRSPDNVSPIAIGRQDSMTIALALSPPSKPELPRKSSKRQTTTPSEYRLSAVPDDSIESLMMKNTSRGTRGLTITIPESKRMTDDFTLSPIPSPVPPPKAVERTITPSVAENVLLGILQNLECLDDLFAAAVINRGFYRVFKRHEIDLIKNTLRRESPPAWEFREICYPGHDRVADEAEMERPREEYTPTTYIRYFKRDMYIVAAIKALIKDECDAYIRPEISHALISEDPHEAARVDDALWRIWTFCKIFGSGKGREQDAVAQMDWLKGGHLVHQSTCSFNVFSPDDLNDTLASAPECFAKGNEGGLTAEQLFDMMELWKCLGLLLQPFEGRTYLAREFGVYDNTNVRGGDIDGEEMMLDEWYYYVLTLGFSPILELASPCRRSDRSAFLLASQRGLMAWQPPVSGGTRKSFFKEVAYRLYEEKITAQYAESSTREVQRQLSKQRIQKHITELRHRQNSKVGAPEDATEDRRSSSEWDSDVENMCSPRPPVGNGRATLMTHIPALRSTASSSAIAHQLSISVSDLPQVTRPSQARSQSPPRRIVAQPLLPSPPPSTVPSARDRNSVAVSMPSINEHPVFRSKEIIPETPSLDQHPAFRQHFRQMSEDSNNGAPSLHSSNNSSDHSVYQQHPLQREMFNPDNAQNSSDRAIHRIVEMGFTVEQAKRALCRTDLGDGLRIDRAVEMLLREMC